MPRIRRLGIAAVMTAAMALGGAPAFATEALTPSGYVTDVDGFLSDEERATIATSAESFSTKFSTVITIVIVPNFSDQTPSEWCQATLTKVRDNDKVLLYAVGYEEGIDTYCFGQEITQWMRNDSIVKGYVDSALSEAHRTYKSTPLTSKEAAAGPKTLINSLRSSFETYKRIRSEYDASSQRLKDESRKEEIKGFVAFLIVGILLVIGIFFDQWKKQREQEEHDAEIEAAAWRIQRRREERDDKAARHDADKLVQQANDRLAAADLDVRDAMKEWDYARAQFGIAATEQFRSRIKGAKEALSRGDALLQKCRATLNPETRKTLATQIISDLDTHMGLLSDAQAPFSTKRSELTSLPTRLAEAQERLAEELVDVKRSRDELATIAGIYPGTVLSSLEDNPDKAASLLASARSAIESAQAIIDTDTELATSAVDTAERALLMAHHEMNAIFTAKLDLDNIEDRLGAAIASLSSDIEETDHLHTDPTLLTPLITDARAAITRAQEALIHNDNPLDALEHARAVETKLNATLDPLRTAEHQSGGTHST